MSILASAARHEDIYAISAITGEGQAALLAAIARKLESERHPSTLTLPFHEGRKRAWLHDQGVIEAEKQTEDGFELSLLWTARQEKRFRDL